MAMATAQSRVKRVGTGGALLVIVTHLVLIRSVLQAFLNRGLVEWYETKHSTDVPETLDILAKYLKSALQRRLYVLGKVSVQGITLPLLLISLVPFNLMGAGVGPGAGPGAGGEGKEMLWEVVARMRVSRRRWAHLHKI